MERHDADFWRERIAEQRQAGLGIRKYCESHGFCRNTFQRWRKRLENDERIRGFVEVGKAPNVAKERAALPGVMIELADGVRIHFPDGSDPSMMGAVVMAIRSAS